MSAGSDDIVHGDFESVSGFTVGSGLAAANEIFSVAAKRRELLPRGAMQETGTGDLRQARVRGHGVERSTHARTHVRLRDLAVTACANVRRDELARADPRESERRN